MKVVSFGPLDEAVSPRVRLLRAGLSRNGVELVDCHATGRALLRWPRLCVHFARVARGADVILVPKPGQREVPLARALSRRIGAPVVHDFFASLWINQIFERHRAPPNSALAHKFHALDRTALRLSDRSLVDTHSHGRLFVDRLGARASKLSRVPVGAEDLFRPRRGHRPSGRPTFEVLWYGTHIPFHGVDVIVEAAARLRARESIRFTLVGDGPTRADAEARAARLGLGDRLRFVAPQPYEDLPHWIADADLCLGTFGDTPTARAVVPKKVYATLASARPVLCADVPGTRELIDDDACFRCRPGDPEALAQAIREIAESPREREQRAGSGRALHERRFTTEAIGRRLCEVLEDVVRAHRDRSGCEEGMPA